VSYKDTGREPASMIGGLGSLYESLGALHWPLIRATAGIILFTHGWPKLMMGFQAVAANTLATRGIEPALPLAYALVLLETAGAICILLGFLTRPIAIMLVVEFAVIVYQHFPTAMAGRRAATNIRCCGVCCSSPSRSAVADRTQSIGCSVGKFDAPAHKRTSRR
jgi:uncharacterized membrane protein YphA (DoxX/SURF4 family)